MQNAGKANRCALLATCERLLFFFTPSEKREEMNRTTYTTSFAAAAAEEEEVDVGTCSICFLAFSPSEAESVPRLLKCGHSFCTACLTHLLDATSSTNREAEPEEATSLRCPSAVE
jgi:hypothetical protein